MAYKTCERSLLETATRESSEGRLTVETYVTPDGVVISDGEESIRISKGKKESTAFVEVSGEAFHVRTEGCSRLVSVEMFIRDVGKEYNGDLVSTALSFK